MSSPDGRAKARNAFNSPKPQKKKVLTPQPSPGAASDSAGRGSNKGTPPNKVQRAAYAQPNSPIAAAVQRKTKAAVAAKRRAAAEVEADEEASRQAVFSPVYKKDSAADEDESVVRKRRVSADNIKPQLHVPVPATESEGEEEEEDLDEDEFDPFLFIKHLPALTPEQINRPPCLPKKTSKKITLALDLDETLVHCSVQPIEKAALTFNVSFNGIDYKVYVRMRPHLQTFLKEVSQWFEVVVFTASQKVYADKLLNILDPKHEYIQHRVFRDSCVNIDGNYLKDLHILGRDLGTTAIVDNSVQAFGFQLDNGIPIESWFDDEEDEELLNLIPFLRNLKDCKDVRPLIRTTFRLQEFVNSLN